MMMKFHIMGYFYTLLAFIHYFLLRNCWTCGFNTSRSIAYQFQHIETTWPGIYFIYDIFILIFLYYFFIQISLKFVPRGPVDNKSALVEIMAWCQISAKPLSRPVMA